MNLIRQSGFTLVETAIVLVIIGLLLGGILKGQELINSARVRNLADTTSGVQAAYFGFVDRYRQAPGDWSQVNAQTAIGTVITTGGNEDGQIDHIGNATSPWEEPLAMWEHIAAAGFIPGAYLGGLGEPTAGANSAPENPYNGLLLVGLNDDYIDGGTAVARRLVVLGRFVPADIMQELDTKLDDGRPQSGDLRATIQTGSVWAGANNWGGYGATSCIDASTPPAWDVANNPDDCNGVYFF